MEQSLPIPPPRQTIHPPRPQHRRPAVPRSLQRSGAWPHSKRARWARRRARDDRRLRRRKRSGSARTLRRTVPPWCRDRAGQSRSTTQSSLRGCGRGTSRRVRAIRARTWSCAPGRVSSASAGDRTYLVPLEVELVGTVGLLRGLAEGALGKEEREDGHDRGRVGVVRGLALLEETRRREDVERLLVCRTGQFRPGRAENFTHKTWCSASCAREGPS